MMELLKIVGLLFGFVTAVWLVSLRAKDASIVDRVWGLLFVLLAVSYLAIFDGSGWRVTLLIVLVAVWGLRLSLHIHIRNRGHSEDVRYTRMRDHHGSSFWWYSFFSVFMLQGLLALLISAPLFAVLALDTSQGFGWYDAVGLLLWLIGFAFEAGGDLQLVRFKSNPDNKGKLLTTGFWGLTRHPNYFGDACLWWGYYFFALSADYGWLTIFGPILMTGFIRYVSGVSLLEKDLINVKPGYAAYIATTPAFVPRLWPRKG